MSLDFNLSACTNLSEAQRKNSLTRDIIFASLIVHLGTINERNANEWATRLRILKRIGVLDLSIPDEHLHATISLYKGLRVNVADKSRLHFLKYAIGMIERDVESEMRREARQANDEASGASHAS